MPLNKEPNQTESHGFGWLILYSISTLVGNLMSNSVYIYNPPQTYQFRSIRTHQWG